MKAIHDRAHVLADGLAAIRAQFDLDPTFPDEVEAAATAAAASPIGDHRDRSDENFVTLDPLSSTDLDQAFRIEKANADLLLHYAIADVSAFVEPGGVIDRSAWARGETYYLPDGRVSLYPTVLCEGAASLLPAGPRPAIVFAVRVSPDGKSRLDGAERAMIQSRSKLAYATVTESDLPPGFGELSRRIAAAEQSRGAARVDPPQQQVVESGGSECFALEFRPMSPVEQDNAALSLACNLAIADVMFAAGTGLFRVMAEPGLRAVARLRHTAAALGVDWPTNMKLKTREKTLDPNNPKHAAFMLAIRRAGRGARYEPFQQGVIPWHSAMAATYAHGTAPLRRLADRYVNEATLAIACGKPVPDWAASAFAPLAPIMNQAEARAAQVDSAVVELAEAVVLEARVGEMFAGRVTGIDDRGARVQLCAEPVVTRVQSAALALGQEVKLKLTEAVPAQRITRFELES